MTHSRDPRESEPGSEQSEVPALLRDAATRAVGIAHGAVLVLTRDVPGDELRLRTAAGVPSPEAARVAAGAIAEAASRVARDAQPARAPASEALAAAGAGGFLLLPIAGTEQLHGVLAVASPQPASSEASAAFELAAEALAARLDRALLAQEHGALRARLDQIDQLAEQKGDEVLRLSEELFAQDIELLRSKERVGQIEKLKNDFIEKMSCELRTPLNSIIESIIAVLAGENDVLSETAQQCLRRALDEGTSFLRTLQNILDLWRIKQGELPVEAQEVSFREVVEEAIFSVQDTVGNKPIEIERRFEEPLPKFRTDLAKINQILFLLLDNAAKFTSEGRIEIAARVVDGELVCEVADTGIGVCPDDQQFVFDEFYQVDELSSSKYRGSGLGLALVRDLLTLLDGSIAVRSEVGEGCVFTFRVPVVVL